MVPSDSLRVLLIGVPMMLAVAACSSPADDDEPAAMEEIAEDGTEYAGDAIEEAAPANEAEYDAEAEASEEAADGSSPGDDDDGWTPGDSSPGDDDGEWNPE